MFYLACLGFGLDTFNLVVVPVDQSHPSSEVLGVTSSGFVKDLVDDG